MPRFMAATTPNASLDRLRHLRPSSPKRLSQDRSGDWYGDYAGYADTFVTDIVSALPARVKTILDPWNGSGTTTAVSTAHSLASKGFDINPAASGYS